MRIEALFRHPIKGTGFEALSCVDLSAGKGFPDDRRWAVAHEGADVEPGVWAHCARFMRGAKSPRLMQVRAALTGERIRLFHPDLPDYEGAPDDPDDAARLIDWVRPLCDPGRAGPERVISSGALAMTDSDDQGVSVLSLASLAALSEKAGKPLAQERFRGNIWIDGTAPFAELGWVGRRLRIGTAEVEITDPIGRCLSTHADIDTGQRDTDVTGLLAAHFGAEDFGMEARIVTPGRVAVGDDATLI